jgi:hypothetical protein
VGLAKLDVGGAGQLVGAKLGGVSFAEVAASLPGRGRMSAVGGNFLGYYLLIFLFLSGGMRGNLLFGWKGKFTVCVWVIIM